MLIEYDISHKFPLGPVTFPALLIQLNCNIKQPANAFRKKLVNHLPKQTCRYCAKGHILSGRSVLEYREPITG